MIPEKLAATSMPDDGQDLRGNETFLKAGALQRAIFNSANFSSIATDAKGVIQIFNVGAERMLGYTAEEVLNKITPADISDPQEIVERAEALSVELDSVIAPGFEALVFKASRGIEDIYELTYIRKDGSRFPAVVSVTALRDAELAVIGYLLIGTDNTTRKQIEAEQTQLAQRLRDHQFYTRSLFESNIDALMTTDTDGIITDVNKQMEALTGCTRDELIGAPFKNFFTDPGRAEAGIKLALSKRKITDYELTARNRDGKETVVSYNATTLYDRDRRLQGVFAAVRDISERKQYERSLHELNTTLERRVLISTSELKEREAMLQEIHHRVKNNLQVISSLINMQVRRLSDASSRLALQECQSRVQAMALIHEMLYQSENYSSVQFADYTRSLAANIFHATGVSQATVGLDLSIEDLSLAVDKAIPCGLILNELITNALKHAFPNERRGVIHVILRKVSDRDIILSVADDGIGLPESFDMEKLNSLGMQLVATLVEQLEGHLEITRSSGTVFNVTFSATALS